MPTTGSDRHGIQTLSAPCLLIITVSWQDTTHVCHPLAFTFCSFHFWGGFRPRHIHVRSMKPTYAFSYTIDPCLCLCALLTVVPQLGLVLSSFAASFSSIWLVNFWLLQIHAALVTTSHECLSSNPFLWHETTTSNRLRIILLHGIYPYPRRICNLDFGLVGELPRHFATVTCLEAPMVLPLSRISSPSA